MSNTAPRQLKGRGGLFIRTAVAAVLAYALAAAAATPVYDPARASISGLWLASVQTGALRVPFRFGISAHAGKATGWFFNGSQRVTSTSGTFERGRLTLNYPSYAHRLDATLNADGTLTGKYAPVASSKARSYSFQARRDFPAARESPSERAPRIAGLWLIPVHSRKAAEGAWRLTVRQSGPRVSAAILRVDGDTGALTGSWREGRLLLSHFDGARPAAIDVTPAPGGTLRLAVHEIDGPDVILTAYRARVAAAKGLPAAANPELHTHVRNPAEAFRFSFPDLDGRIVSNTDKAFRGKVLLVDVAGSWCPNCHDEAPFLEALYRKYHRQGLDVVTLAFEESDQLEDPVELRAFVKQYGITYPVLVAGTPDELQARIPQAVGLDAFPTTFFIGRDGRVRAVHAGFAAPATGVFNTRLKQSFGAEIERLLRQRATSRYQNTSVRSSTLRRGGASGSPVGSSNAVWAVRRARPAAHMNMTNFSNDDTSTKR